MTGGLGWAKNIFSSCKREVVERANDLFLLQLSLTNSYMITDFSEDELAVGNDLGQVPGIFEECAPDERNEGFWEGCRVTSVNEHLTSQELQGVHSDNHRVFCVQHCKHQARHFVVLESPVTQDGETVFTRFWCTCGGTVKGGVPCRHFLCVYRENPQCGFHCGMFHPMWWVRSRGVENEDCSSAFPLLQVSVV